MADIKMRRNGNKIFIEAASKKGAVWLVENMVAFTTIHVILEAEHGQDMDYEFKKAGLEVEGP